MQCSRRRSRSRTSYMANLISSSYLLPKTSFAIHPSATIPESRQPRFIFYFFLSISCCCSLFYSYPATGVSPWSSLSSSTINFSISWKSFFTSSCFDTSATLAGLIQDEASLTVCLLFSNRCNYRTVSTPPPPSSL